eukprot:IDg4031t1
MLGCPAAFPESAGMPPRGVLSMHQEIETCTDGSLAEVRKAFMIVLSSGFQKASFVGSSMKRSGARSMPLTRHQELTAAAWTTNSYSHETAAACLEF